VSAHGHRGEVVADHDGTVEVRGGVRHPLVDTARWWGGYVVGEHECAGAGRGLGDRRVVVEDVLELREWDLPNQVVADDGLHVGVGAGAEGVDHLTDPGRHGRRR